MTYDMSTSINSTSYVAQAYYRNQKFTFAGGRAPCIMMANISSCQWIDLENYLLYCQTFHMSKETLWEGQMWMNKDAVYY